MTGNRVSAEQFIQAFSAAALTHEDRAPTAETSTAWTELAWDILHDAAARLEQECACRRCGAKKGRLNAEWLWDLTWYAEQSKPRFVQPTAIIEHENSHNDDAFLDDFWKVLVAWAPLRVAIGYTGRSEALLDRRIQVINAAIQGWSFPGDVEDVVVQRRYAADPTTPPQERWSYLVRQGTSFAPVKLTTDG